MIGSCRFEKLMYYPDCGLKGKVGDDGNVTRQLVSYNNWHQYTDPRSVLRSAAIVETGVQRAYELIQGYKFISCSQQLAYVAHIRKNWKRKKC